MCLKKHLVIIYELNRIKKANNCALKCSNLRNENATIFRAHIEKL